MVENCAGAQVAKAIEKSGALILAMSGTSMLAVATMAERWQPQVTWAGLMTIALPDYGLAGKIEQLLPKATWADSLVKMAAVPDFTLQYADGLRADYYFDEEEFDADEESPVLDIPERTPYQKSQNPRPLIKIGIRQL